MDEQGSEWVAFIAKELDREYDRRDRLNTRSATAITSATTLVTLSLAVMAVLKGQHLVVSGALKVGSLLGALVLLLAAAVLSILAGATRSRFDPNDRSVSPGRVRNHGCHRLSASHLVGRDSGAITSCLSSHR
jgi:hypothetical protein